MIVFFLATGWLPKLRRRGCEKFTLVLETNGTRQLERKQGQIILTIILQMNKHLPARETHATMGVTNHWTTNHWTGIQKFVCNFHK